MDVRLVQLAAGIDPAENREHVDARLGALEPGPQLVVLPEATMTDFGPTDLDLDQFAEPLDGPFVDLLARHARRLGATVVAGSFEKREDAPPFNTLVVVGPDGGLTATYRKIHLYDSFGYRESDRLSAGELSPVTIEVAGRTIGLMTCYDLRFPELARLLVDAGADTLVIPAAWVAGEGKLHHWRTLLTARAIENTVHVLAAAQGGRRYTGHSLVLDPSGSIVVEAGEGDETLSAVLDPDEPGRTRATNPSLANRRIPPRGDRT
ncbi:carbon-nitrogen hydrolase family protein [Aeromicrobium sp. Leaf350]|uniref:carbon-nitrogen hydrolase family protein n=1 Tax=Aeromicrobium sp. Leaf350 TaxID=2876565 RepID=UPI001E5D6235|nr:carbon-nitrogen hydrolase family protein [Aeromicrobium sp. Leaf350]